MNIITFERFKVIHDPSVGKIREYVKANGWKNFRADWDRFMSDNLVVLERLPGE